MHLSADHSQQYRAFGCGIVPLGPDRGVLCSAAAYTNSLPHASAYGGHAHADDTTHDNTSSCDNSSNDAAPYYCSPYNASSCRAIESQWGQNPSLLERQ